jgi:hypothetical protein
MKDLTQLYEWYIETKRLMENLLEELNDGILTRKYNQVDMVFNIQSKLDKSNKIEVEETRGLLTNPKSSLEDAIIFATNWTEANKIRPLDEIVKELKLHPDYISHSIWTLEGVKNCIEIEIEDYYEDNRKMRMMIDQIYLMNKEIIHNNIDANFADAYKYFYLLDDIEYPKEFIDLKEKCD